MKTITLGNSKFITQSVGRGSSIVDVVYRLDTVTETTILGGLLLCSQRGSLSANKMSRELLPLKSLRLFLQESGDDLVEDRRPMT